VIRQRVTLEELPAFLGKAFGEILRVAGQQQATPTGPPYGRYRPTDGGFDVEVGFPVSAPVKHDLRVEPGTLPAGRAAKTMHVGDYSEVGAAYEDVQKWLADHDLVPHGPPFECYLDGPDVPNPRTEVYFPCRSAE
jgi:effector-binding domain-containing protein